MSSKVRVRMAPSPTGYLHVGHARTALFNWLFARRQGGVFVLRIEDTDPERSGEEFIRPILEGLQWLGLHWDEGPYFQSQRLELYRSESQRLLETGNAYLCFCTPEELEQRRKEMLAKGIAPRYDRRCRPSATGHGTRDTEHGTRPAALRFMMPDEGETVFRDLVRGEIRFKNSELDDFVLMRSDGMPTYNFACVVDDHHFQITHVIRGEDHISNTPRQLHLYRVLGYPPPQFAHLPMILGKDRSKLSKRHGATALIEYRDMGILPEAMFNFLALLGWSPKRGETQEIFSQQELIERFSLEDVNPSGAIFDFEKLLWMNGHYIRQCPLERLTNLCLPYLQKANLLPAQLDEQQKDYAHKVISLVQDRLRLLSEAPELTPFFFKDDFDCDEKAVRKWLTTESAPLLEKLVERLKGLEEFSKGNIETIVRGIAAEQGVSAAKLIHPTRVAISGRTEGPPLFDLMEVLGKERCLKRLWIGIQRAKGVL